MTIEADMSTSQVTDASVEDMTLDGSLAPPMANGELVFEYPWQGRVFGIARLLSEKGVYTWDEFRSVLIRTLDGVPPEGFEYYDRFLVALSKLLEEKGCYEARWLEQKSHELAHRPHGHDH